MFAPVSIHTGITFISADMSYVSNHWYIKIVPHYARPANHFQEQQGHIKAEDFLDSIRREYEKEDKAFNQPWSSIPLQDTLQVWAGTKK